MEFSKDFLSATAATTTPQPKFIVIWDTYALDMSFSIKFPFIFIFKITGFDEMKISYFLHGNGIAALLVLQFLVSWKTQFPVCFVYASSDSGWRDDDGVCAHLCIEHLTEGSKNPRQVFLHSYIGETQDGWNNFLELYILCSKGL
jgi:hypothetical protein